MASQRIDFHYVSLKLVLAELMPGKRRSLTLCGKSGEGGKAYVGASPLAMMDQCRGHGSLAGKLPQERRGQSFSS